MILIIHCRFCHFSRGPAGGGGGGGRWRQRGAAAAGGGGGSGGQRRRRATPDHKALPAARSAKCARAPKKKAREELGLGRLR